VNIKQLHPWNLDYREAVRLQEELAKQIRFEPIKAGSLHIVAGVDVSAVRGSKSLWASVVVLNLESLELVEVQSVKREWSFPYIPGLLSFRELPVVLAAFSKLQNIPDVILCDGQGLAHPRFLGLACHLGLWLNLPTIGCAKSRLVGDGNQPGEKRGDFSPLSFKEKQVGVILRTRSNVKPLYVSPGHKMDINSAIDLVLKCGRGLRLPEPTRLAHIEVNKFRKSCL